MMRTQSPALSVEETRTVQRPHRSDAAVIAQYIQDLLRAS
jgi:hypothetical protein